MAIATWSARRRSSCRVSLRSRMRLRMRSRAARYSSSSLACSGQQIAQVEGEHMKHLLKTPRETLAGRRTKGKHYFRLLFDIGFSRLWTAPGAMADMEHFDPHAVLVNQIIDSDR